MEIVVARGIESALLAEAGRAAPLEACGLLLGREGMIDRVQACPNVADEPDRHFEIDPQSLFDAHRDAREGGPQLIGYWHSHPRGPAEPSFTDQACAAGDDRVWAIVGEGRVGWFRDRADGFAPLCMRETESVWAALPVDRSVGPG